jgi:hypothetical protein
LLLFGQIERVHEGISLRCRFAIMPGAPAAVCTVTAQFGPDTKPPRNRGGE